MRWEDQELNYSTPEGKFPEVLWTHFSVLSLAEKHAATFFNKPRSFLKIDQACLDKLLLEKKLSERARGVRIDRLCLRFRLACQLNPGGGRDPDLGVMQYWAGKKNRGIGRSLYAIVQISSQNDWLKIFVVEGDAPAQMPSPIASGATIASR